MRFKIHVFPRTSLQGDLCERSGSRRRFEEDIYFSGVSSYRRCRHRISIEKWRVVDDRKSEEYERSSKGGSKESQDHVRRHRRRSRALFPHDYRQVCTFPLLTFTRTHAGNLFACTASRLSSNEPTCYT